MKKLIFAIIVLLFTISCAGVSPKGEDLAEQRKAAEQQIMAEGMKGYLKGVPTQIVDKYMTLHENELHHNIDVRYIKGIARHANVLTIIFNSDTIFEENSFIPKMEAYTSINRIAQIINKFQHTMVFVTGNNQMLASGHINQMSESRAVTLGEILVQRGVNQMRIHPIGVDGDAPMKFLDVSRDKLTMVIIPVTI